METGGGFWFDALPISATDKQKILELYEQKHRWESIALTLGVVAAALFIVLIYIHM